MKWETVKLDSLGEFMNGVNFKSEKMGHGLRLINVKNVFSSGTFLDFKSLDLVDLEQQSNISNYFVQEGDIFFVRSSVKRDGIGLVTMARYSDNETVHCGFVIRFRPKSEKLSSLFLTYLLRTPEYRNKLINLSSGATITNISQTTLKTLEIPLPPLPTQEKIADRLSKYDDLIDNNNRRIALLEESVHLLYREWFVKMRFPGYESARFIDGIPEGWEMKPLGNICQVIMGQSPKSEFYNIDKQGLPFHQGVKNFSNRFVEHETYCTFKTRIAESGDILCSVRAPVGRLNITLDKIIIGRGLSAIKNIKGYQSFQYYQLKSYFVQEDMIGGGTIFASVTKNQLIAQKMIIPKQEIIERFENYSKKIDQQIINLYRQNQKLKEARDGLLARLMNGNIEV